MPLYKSITVDNYTKVLIWKIEETEKELYKGIVLTPYDQERVAGMKSEIHRKGYLSIRQLLKRMDYKASDLYYDDEGRPHLKNGNKISITHSFQFSAIIISDKVIGIDIEKQRDKIKAIATKFVGEEDRFVKGDVEMLTYVWCIKESLYKAYATPGISFKEHIGMLPFSREDRSGKAWVIYNGDKHAYRVCFLNFEGFGCAYAIKNNE